MSILQKRVLIIAVLAAVMGFLAFHIISNPANSIMRSFRGSFSSTDAKVVFGPYPLKADIFELKNSGITTIVTLLNPALPYEKKLLEEEKENARQFGVVLLNYPMNPVPIMLGHKSEANEEQAAAAAKAAMNAKGKVYIHCYLGLHRVSEVRETFNRQGRKTATYLGRKGDRNERATRLDAAQRNFNAGDFKAVVKALGPEKAPDPRELILLGWSYYRLGEIAAAKARFSQAQELSPGNVEAGNGLGYSALRAGDHETAGKAFNESIRSDPGNASAYTGRGMLNYRKGKLKDAASDLKKALEIDPANGDAKEALQRIPANLR